MHAPTGGAALVTNSGVILADGGTVQLTARAADGIVQNLVQAGGKIRAATVGDQTGTIALNGVGGSIIVEGQLSAPGAAPGTKGGNIQVATTGNVVVASTAKINASGKAGGGNIGIGTTLDRVKGGPSVTPAQVAANTTISKGATIKANATQKGDGGRVVVLSDMSGGTTRMDGLITAKGGAQGGDGGFVEVSGGNLGMNTGMIDLSAPRGKAGNVLFDPRDLDIVAAGANDGQVTSTGVPVGNPDQSTDITVSASALTSLAGNLQLEASRNLKIDAALAFTNQAAGQSVTMLAGNNLTVNQAVSTAGGDLTMRAAVATDGVTPFTNVSAAGALTINANVGSGTTGNITLSAGTGGITLNAGKVTTPGRLDLTTTGAVNEAGAGIIGAGTLQSTGGITGAVTLMNNSNSVGTLAAMSTGAFSLVNSSALTLGGTLVAGGDVSLTTLSAGSDLKLGTSGAIGSAGKIVLKTFGVGSDLTLNGDLTAGTDVSLTAGGSITQPGGKISATNLAATTQADAGAPITLDRAANAITGNVTLSVQKRTTTVQPAGATGNINFVDTSGFTLTGTDQTSVGGTLTLKSSGAITEDSAAQILTSLLTGTSTSLDATASSLNNVGTIGSFNATAGDFSLKNSASLTVAGPLSGTNVKLTTTGGTAIDVTGKITGTTAITLDGGSIALETTADVEAPTITLTGSTGIALNGSALLGVGGAAVDLNTTGGNVIEASTATIVATTLQSTSGVTGNASLLGPNQVVNTGKFTTTGDFFLTDTRALTVGNTISASGNVYIEDSNLLGITIGAAGKVAAGANKLASFQANVLNITAGGKITGGTFEYGLDTPGALTLGAGGNLPKLVGVGTTTAEIGDVTVAGSGSTPTATSIATVATFDGNNLSVVLNTTGAITEAAGSPIINVATLSGTAASANLNAANAVSNIGSFTAKSGTFLMTDGGLAGTFTVSGPLTSITNNVTLSGSPALNVTGSIGAAATVSLNSVEIDLAAGAVVTGPTVKLNAGSTGIAFTGNATIGQSGGTVDINSAGTISEPASSVIIAGTLAATSGISGDVQLFGTANAIDNLGSIAISPGVNFALKDASALNVIGTVAVSGASTQLYLQSSNSGGITIGSGGALKADSGSGLVSLQADAFTNNGSVAAATVEMAPNTSNLAMTLGDVGGLSLISQSGFKTGNFIFGAVSVPGGSQTTTAGSINVAGTGFDTAGVSTVTLDATGAVTQTAKLTGNSKLQGKAASFTLLNSGNDFSAIALNATAGDIQVVDSASVILSGNTASANIYIAAPSETLQGVITAGGILGLQTDKFTRTSGSLTGTTVELAPLTSGTTESLGSGSGLVLSDATFITGNLRIGAVTVPSSGLKTTAGSISVGANFGTGSLVLELDSLGAIGQTAGAILTAGTLTGASVSDVKLDVNANSIDTLGSFSVSSGAFALNDGGGGVLNLTVSGPVTGTNITIRNAPTISIDGSIDAAGAVLIQSGAGGIALTSNARVGRTGAIVDFGTTGGRVTEAAGGIVTASTLQSSIGVSGSFDLSASSNNIANLGSIAVTGGAFSLDDTGRAGTLGVSGPVTATNVSITGGTGAVLVTGSIGATGTVSLDGSNPTAGIALNSGAVVTGATIKLDGGSIGIAMNGNASLGNAGAVVDLNSRGGAIEASTATITAGTLESTGTFVGNADLLSPLNSIGTLGNFAVTGGSSHFDLADDPQLVISGSVSAPGRVYLVSTDPGGIAVASGATVSAGTLASFQAGAFTNSGTVISATFEWAPDTVGSTQTLSSLSGIPNDVRIGAVTLPGSSSPTITAGSIVVSADFGTTLTTLELDTSGGITQTGGSITAASLVGQAGTTVSLTKANVIATVGSFGLGAGDFILNDGGLSGDLTVNGPVNGATVSIKNAPTITINGTIAGTAEVVIASGAGGIALTSTGNINSPSGIVDFSTTGGGVSEVAGGVVTAGTLQSPGTVVGLFNLSLGSNNVANLGSVAVSGGDFSLTDTGRVGTLGVSGPVTADDVFIVSGAGALIVTGSIGATGTVDLDGSNLAAGVQLNGGAAVTGATIDVNGGVNGIALNGNASLGNTGAVVDLTTAGGGVTEAATATVTAGTLQSPGTVVGTFDLSRGANNIANLGIIKVKAGTGDFLIGDSGRVGTLGVSGPVTADNVFIVSGAGALMVTGSIGATGTVDLDGSNLAAGVRLNGGAVVTGATIEVNGGVNGIALNGNASLGNTGAVVDLTTAGGGVTEASTAVIVAGILQSPNGVSGNVALPSTSNKIDNIGSFAINGGGTFILNDSVDLNVSGKLTASTITVTDAGLLTVSNSLVATSAVSLTASNIAIPGLVSDGGSGTTSLVANAGTINETGTLIAGTLSGSASNGAGPQAASLTGTANQIATLGSFSASTFSLNDSTGLNVTGPMNVTSSASIKAASIDIPGLVNAGAAGSTTLIATSGTIGETGTLITGTLTGSAAGAASLLGSSFSNQVGTLGSFSATQFSLNDGVSLNVAGPLTASSGVAIDDVGSLLVSGTIAPPSGNTAIAVGLTAATINIPGVVSDGGAGTTNLITNGDTIGETGTLISGTLSGTAAAGASLQAANLLGTGFANQVANLGPFLASSLTLNDGANLNVTGPVSAGTSATIVDTGSLTISGTLGNVIGPISVGLTAAAIGISGLVNSGSGAGTLNLVANGGAITENGTLITGTLTGSAVTSASLLGSGSNAVSNLGNFTATEFALNDSVALNISGVLTAGKSATIVDPGSLLVTGTIAPPSGTNSIAVVLTGATLNVAGLVSDGGAGTTSLVANAGTIGETGTLISGTLSGSAKNGSALQATNLARISNQIGTLGSFSASSFALQDSVNLIVAGLLTAGSSVSILDSGTVLIPGTIMPANGTTAIPVGITAAGIGISGLVSDGGSGSTSLVANAGAINETGTLIAGTLSGSATSSANFAGATSTSNNIGTVTGFTAFGFTLNDGANLTVSGSLSGGPSVTVFDQGNLTIGGVVNATAVALTATGTINDTGILTTGTLSGGASGTATFSNGANQIVTLGSFTANGLTLADATSLTINGIVNGGTFATISDAGGMTVSPGGALIANTVSVTTKNDIVIDGLVRDTNSVNLVTTNGAILEQGTIVADVLNGNAFGNATLIGNGSNRIAQLGSFTSGQTLALHDSTDLIIRGPVTAPSIFIDAGANAISLADGAVITTSGTSRPQGIVTVFPPDTDSRGIFLTTAKGFTQQGNSTVVGLGGGPSVLRINALGGANIAFDSAGGLSGPDTWLILSLESGRATGQVNVKNLDVIRANATGGSSDLFGSLNALSGSAAAGAAGIQPNPNSNFRFNSCAIHSVNCVLLPTQGLPTASPLNDIYFGSVFNPNDEDDLLLPIVSDRDY